MHKMNEISVEDAMFTKMNTGLRWTWVTVAVVVLDRISKWLATHFLTAYQPLPVMKFFNLTLAYNTGAAFSFLNRAGGWQTWFFGGLAIVISSILLIWLYRLSAQQRWLCIALALIIGGALGNLFDRVYYGQVTDFLQFYVSHFYWPVFNIADSAVCIGAGMLFFDAMFKKK